MLVDQQGGVECAGPGRDVLPFPLLRGRTDRVSSYSSFTQEDYSQHAWEWEEDMPAPKYRGRDGYLQA